MVARRVADRIGTEHALVLASLLASAPLIVVALSPTDPVLASVVLILAFAIVGAGWTLGAILTVSLRQRSTPPEALARVNATYRFLASGVASLGVLAGGVIAGLVGLRIGMLAGAIGSCVTIACALSTPIRRHVASDAPETATEAVTEP
jgi:MFS family permease